MPVTVVEGRRLVLTNLDKVLYPAAGTRKGELLEYYRRIHSALLPHLRDRPVSFVRYPDGVDGQRFFAKHLPPGTPGWVRTATVPSKTHGTRTHVLVEDLATLMWAGNLAALELHVPQWHAEQPAVADRLVLDLDPGDGADVLTCRAAAVLLRDRLAADGLTCWAKTSGSKGLHLLVPITDTPSAEVSAYAKAVAEELAAAHPHLLIASMAKARRKGRVFLDWSQNNAAKTTAAPYTVRAREAPTVSTPVTWDELAAASHPDDLAFTIHDVPDRVADLGDLLAPLLNPRRARPLPAPTAADTARPSRQAPSHRATSRKTEGKSGDAPAAPGLTVADPLPLPEPMLAAPVEVLPAAGAWVFEPKWDGFRVLLGRDPGGAARLVSRRGTVLTQAFGDIAAAAERDLPDGVLLDGEAVIWDEGRLSFDLLQQRINRTAAAATREAAAHPANYVAFDVLHAGGRDLTVLPYRERRAALERLFADEGLGPPWVLCPATGDRAEAEQWMRDWAPAGIEGLLYAGVVVDRSTAGLLARAQSADG